jgi:hypothetical protein
MIFLYFCISPELAAQPSIVFFSTTCPQEKIFSLYSMNDFGSRERIAEVLFELRLIQGHFLHDQMIDSLIRGRSTKILCFIRHPVERLVSEYIFLKNWPYSHVYHLIHGHNISFAEYIRSEAKEFRYRTKNLMTRIFARLPFEGVVPPPGVVQKAVEQAMGYNLLGFTEYFDESLLFLRDAMGLANVYYEQQNTLALGMKDGINAEDMAIAAEYNQSDLEIYRILKADFEAKLAAMPSSFKERVNNFKRINSRMNKVMKLIDERDGLNQGDILNPKRVWDCIID